VDNTWSPVVNMWTDDRFGRFQEGFSPDPTITTHMARALVVGIQGGVASENDYLPGGPNVSAWATAKHYAGYGSAAGGLNGGPFTLSNRTLFEHYLRPWRALAAIGLRGAMPSHNTVLDVPMHGNRWLTRNVLRSEFGAGNISLVSDCNDIGAMQYFRVAGNLSRNTGLAMRAGVDGDLQCGQLGTGTLADAAYFSNIPATLQDGFASEADLDELVVHVLTQKFAAGLFDAPLAPEAWLARLDAPPARALAYEAASQSIVLLQNNGVLPLDLSKQPRLALIGPHMVCKVGQEAGEGSSAGSEAGKPTGCDARDAMLGSYTLDDGLVSVPLLPAALNSSFPGVPFTVSSGCAIDGDPRLDLIPAALAAAAAADYAIVALGDSLATCGEWADRDSLDLPGGQLALLGALLNGTTTPVVVVLIHGRAASFGPANALLAQCAAVVEAWRPGEEGARAVWDILAGLVAPSGKLVSQWAQNVGQMNSGAQPWLARRRAKWLSNKRSPPDPTDGRVYDSYVATAYSSLPLFRFVSGRE
jgi:beta-glucosidase